MRLSDQLIAGILGTDKWRRFLVAKYRRELDSFLSSRLTIDFAPPGRDPDVSVIIPVYNGAYHLLRCLRSISGPEKARMQVVIYDDCSQDRTQELVGKCSNVTYVRGSRNLGFIGAATAAIESAGGRHLLLMNSDAKLLEGAVSTGVDLLDSNPDWGMIGVRIRLATGKLQEAGCMIFNDGAADGYLWAGSPEDPRAMVRREVDYSSGAFLYIRGSAFHEVGGFDKAYSPAYYEETDLAMRFRQRGLKTMYEPGILVEHFEFGSQPKSAAREAIALRREVFRRKWGQILATSEFEPPSVNPHRYSMRRTSPPRAILVVKPQAGRGNPDLVKRVQSKYSFVCLFLLGGDTTLPTRRQWQINPQVELASGSLKQLQDHLSSMEHFYDAVLASDSKTLESLNTLGHVGTIELLAA